jgi:chaperonin GroES
MTALRPLHDRVLIAPHKNPDVSTSGLLHLPENRTDQYLEMQGTVVAVGTKSDAVSLDAVEAIVLEADSCADSYKYIVEALKALRSAPFDVQVGDDVLFSWTVGQEITIDDVKYLLLREEDILAVLEPA